VFKIERLQKNGVCLICDKGCDVFVADCNKGVFAGEICAKCLLKQVELRMKAEQRAKKDEPPNDVRNEVRTPSGQFEE